MDWGICVVCEFNNSDYDEQDKPIVFIPTMSINARYHMVCGPCINELKKQLDISTIKMNQRLEARINETRI